MLFPRFVRAARPESCATCRVNKTARWYRSGVVLESGSLSQVLTGISCVLVCGISLLWWLGRVMPGMIPWPPLPILTSYLGTIFISAPNSPGSGEASASTHPPLLALLALCPPVTPGLGVHMCEYFAHVPLGEHGVNNLEE